MRFTTIVAETMLHPFCGPLWVQEFIWHECQEVLFGENKYDGSQEPSCLSSLSLLEWNSDSLSSHSEFHGLQNHYYRRQRLSAILSFGVVTSKNFSKLFTRNHTRSTNIDNNRSMYEKRLGLSKCSPSNLW